MTALKSRPLLLSILLLVVVVVVVTVAVTQAAKPRCTYLQFTYAGTPVATSQPFAIDGSNAHCS